jgi:hypothetical protein
LGLLSVLFFNNIVTLLKNKLLYLTINFQKPYYYLFSTFI